MDKLEEDISKKLEEHVEHDNKPIIMRKYTFSRPYLILILDLTVFILISQLNLN